MINVEDIIRVCNGELLSGTTQIKYTGFSTDSRKIIKGNCYIGIKGENFDGNKFYQDAFNNGASLCILDNKDVITNYNLGTIILVDNSIKALGKLAKYKRGLYNIPVVAITGSVGKTSVKDMVTSVLSTQYNVLSTKGNFNNHIGLPLTILGLEDHDLLVVEMGMNHLNELHNLSNIAKPTLSLITNIGTAHIGNLGSRENILKAKLEILDGMDENGILIINNDNDLLRKVEYNNLITIGIDNESDYTAHDIELNAFSSNFYINDDYLSLPIGSRAFIYNALFAYAVGIKHGISKENIIKALESVRLSPHRLELIKSNNYTIIDDTYNASVDSVKNSLSILGKVNGRKVFIFADILEVDGYQEEIHTEIGESCIQNNIDVLICIGSYSKYTYKRVLNSSIECYYYSNNSDAISEIDTIIKKGDTILIKGSHSTNLIEIVDYLK